jgi:type I toxin-antitoxin system toxin SymE
MSQMRSRLAATLQRLPVLARRRRRRVRVSKRTTRRGDDARKPRPWRSPQVLTMTMRLVPRSSTMEEARVPYLRMSGRWLAAHGFRIGEPVYVTVEQGRVILTNTPPTEPGRADLACSAAR